MIYDTWVRRAWRLLGGTCTSELALPFLTFSAVVVAAGAWCRRDVCRSTGKRKSYRLVCGTWVCCAWAFFPAYVVQRVTLSFFTFSVVVTAMVAAPGRDAYYSTGNSARFRMIYSTLGALRRGSFLLCADGKELPYLFSKSYPIFQGVTLDLPYLF